MIRNASCPSHQTYPEKRESLSGDLGVLRLPLGAVRRIRELDPEGRSLGLVALVGDDAAVRLRDHLRDREPEPGSLNRLLDRVRTPKEALKDTRLMNGRDADPPV